MLPGVHEVEDHDRQLVVHAEGDGGGVHHLEALVEDLDVGELGELGGLGVEQGVVGVDAVDARVGALEDGLGADLGGPQGGGGVGGEVRVAGAAGEDHHPALLQVAHGPAADVGLGHLGHLDGGLHPGGLAQRSRASWRARALMTVASMPMVSALARSMPRPGAGHAPPDVAAADHDGDLGAEVPPHLGDLAGDALRRSRRRCRSRWTGRRTPRPRA